jgi:Mg2+ and Co2+ transporter CorA
VTITKQAEPLRSANDRWQWVHAAREGEAYQAMARAKQRAWVEAAETREHNAVRTVWFEEDDNELEGTIAIVPDPRRPDEKRLLHYRVTKDELATIGLFRVLRETNDEARFESRMLACASPIEALLFLINQLLEQYFRWMDEFELELTRAKSEMRETNDGHLFEYIMDLRYMLLHWNAQVIPLKEIRYAAEETFRRPLADSEHFAALNVRLKRVRMLQNEYMEEIDSLLKLDDVTINYRANDIMKTLTVFTVLLTPMTALGAIWGMNFKHMPETDWKWGYAAALAVIFSMMGGIYWYLRKQGWTRSILEVKTPEPRGGKTWGGGWRHK